MSRYQALLLALAALLVSVTMPLVPFWPTGIPLVGVLMMLGYMLRYDGPRPRGPVREALYQARLMEERLESERRAVEAAHNPISDRPFPPKWWDASRSSWPHHE